MDNRKANIIMGLVATVMAIVSVFTLFAVAFGNSDAAGNPSTLGSVYDVMFGNQGFNAVPTLIAAFILQLVAILFCLIGSIMPGRLGAFGLGFAAILLVVAGIFYLVAPNFFLSINKVETLAEEVVLGPGCIVSAIFAFVAALIGVYGGYRAFKA